MKTISTIAVLGAGTMGRGIAHVAMTGGYETHLFDVSGEVLDKAWRRLRGGRLAVESDAAPAFGSARRGNLRLLLGGPQSSAGRPMPDGTIPVPVGWNRIHLIVPDLAA